MNPFFRSALVLAGVLAAVIPQTTMAQQSDSKNQGYLVDTEYRIVMTASGLCVRTSDWTPARAAAAEGGKMCDPDLAAKSEKSAPVTPSQPKPEVPKPKAEAPKAPADKPKAEPAKMLPQKINFSADALFDFDKSELKPAGKGMLDDLTRVLQDAKYEVILAIGHTDRIGSAAYNQKLSVRRAEAVKKHLVGKGIAPNRIYAEGKGKTQPLTKPGDCRSKKGTSLIACLQPDRRVAVEVTGTK